MVPSTNYLFVLQNRNGFPLLVSGVPPDAFSETGQLWGRFVLRYTYKYYARIFKTSMYIY